MIIKFKRTSTINIPYGKKLLFASDLS